MEKITVLTGHKKVIQCRLLLFNIWVCASQGIWAYVFKELCLSFSVTLPRCDLYLLSKIPDILQCSIKYVGTKNTHAFARNKNINKMYFVINIFKIHWNSETFFFLSVFSGKLNVTTSIYWVLSFSAHILIQLIPIITQWGWWFLNYLHYIGEKTEAQSP